MKRVYVCFGSAVLHPQHVDLFDRARGLGAITVGVFSNNTPDCQPDDAQRAALVRQLHGISDVVIEGRWDCSASLEALRPDFFVYSSDWRERAGATALENVRRVLRGWGGEAIEVPGVFIADHMSVLSRVGRLKAALAVTPLVRLLEAHNGLTGLIVERTRMERDGVPREFHGTWLSSLTGSASRGKPDIEAVDLASRLGEVDDILEVTTKPITFDADTGGNPEHFWYAVRTLEHHGVSAVIIEDKVGIKNNSLFGIHAPVPQQQIGADSFARKIAVGVKARTNSAFMIIARIESLILGAGLDDALARAETYASAGADAILIHSQSKTPDEILAFCSEYRRRQLPAPLVVVPTTYSSVSEEVLQESGIRIVIYANHLLRAAYSNMKSVAESILRHGRAKECEELCMPVRDLITLIPTGLR